MLLLCDEIRHLPLESVEYYAATNSSLLASDVVNRKKCQKKGRTVHKLDKKCPGAFYFALL